MKNSLFNFRDDEEREVFIVAIPVLLLFGLLGYWLMSGNTPQTDNSSLQATFSDADNDGVADNADRCINRAGIAANYGCPTKIGYASADNDGDGIKNGVDSCPETFGNAANKGCRTNNSATVKSLNNTSAKPSKAELAATTAPVTEAQSIITAEQSTDEQIIANTVAGQPDDDNDGLSGDEDKCPTMAGEAINNGCPADSDGDGIYDSEDKCPSLAGEDNGCPPDRDNDGIADSSDACPNQIGAAATGGCPADSDGDGVADANDRCPQTAGDPANEGCATDTDGDGVPDNQDQCLNEAGTAENNGCLQAQTDSDGDSVADAVDQCPAIAGNPANNGCPVDSDNDGIADADDLCPNTAGTLAERGCVTPTATITGITAEDQSVLDDALSKVAFNSGSATLTAGSKQILDGVANLMRKYPLAKLEIRGHTDSSGIAENNMRLSMLRARACANHISQTGINITRIVAYGYGESSPITSNDTAEGRSSNRRVEFELKF